MTTEIWRQETDTAWAALQSRLEEWLDVCRGDNTVVVELDWPEGGHGAAPYVQFTVEDDYWLHAEAVSNHFLAETFQLDKSRTQALERLGWSAPTEEVPNYSYDGELPEESAGAADLLVGTLREVYGVLTPAFLRVHGFGDDAIWEDDDTPFGLTPRLDPEPVVDLTAVKAEGPDHLRDLLAAALEPLVDEVEFDPDGDIPVPAGRTTIYVRVEEDAPAIRLFGWLLSDVKWTPRVGHVLNEFNRRLNFVRLVHHDGYVMFMAQLIALPFVPEHLRQSVAGLQYALDGLDERVQARLGGTLIGEEAED